MEEIVNKVAKSALTTLDLEDFYPEGRRIQFDLKDFLFQELILKEKEFREDLKKHDWEYYRNAYVAIDCSVDTIVPAWAYLLVATYLTPFAKKITKGNLKELEVSIFQDVIANLDIQLYENKKVMIKGCSKRQIPEAAYVQLIEKISPFVQSLMFGEACSTVPLMKRK